MSQFFSCPQRWKKTRCPQHGFFSNHSSATLANPTQSSFRLKCIATVIAIIVFCSGCASLAPEYKVPEMPIPQAWGQEAQGLQGAVASTLSWYDYFSDPRLRQLIETALDNNRDLRVAILRVEEARAVFQIQRSALFPEIRVGAQGARGRVPGDLNMSGRSVTSTEYRADVGMSNWELDLWGRVRNLNESALQQWLSTQAGSYAAQMVLISQVASGYLDVRELDERVTLARQTVETRKDSLRIFSRRFELGSASKLERTQVHLLLTQAQSLLAQLEQARASKVYALRLLVGAEPELPPITAPFNETMLLVQLAPSLSSILLTARPDILAAEHRLIAAHADIGAARAAFFPRISLTSNLGTASTSLDSLFSSGSGTWAFVPVLSLPIFDAGRLRSNLDLAEVRRDISVAEYEKTIQNAFREVADALSSRRWLSEQRDVQRLALSIATERARLAQLRYDNGSTTYLEVLDAQRDLLTSEQQLVQAKGALLSSQIALYTALGGGTKAATEDSPLIHPTLLPFGKVSQ